MVSARELLVFITRVRANRFYVGLSFRLMHSQPRMDRCNCCITIIKSTFCFELGRFILKKRGYALVVLACPPEWALAICGWKFSYPNSYYGVQNSIGLGGQKIVIRV